MKKDKEWLKEEVKSLFDKAYHLGKMEYHESEESIHRINSLVDQLDEPETLLQEWIDENKVARINDVRKMTTSDVVTVEKLKNLLVPKQEKPVIPQFVADYIEQSKKDNDSINQVFAFMDDKEDKDLWHWLFPSMYEEKRANQEVFMRAWLDGYEVEKEKRYRVVLPFTVWDGYASEMKESTMFLALDITSGETRFPHSAANVGDYRTDLTESQIKAIDERYWAFAEEVTEHDS